MTVTVTSYEFRHITGYLTGLVMKNSLGVCAMTGLVRTGYDRSPLTSLNWSGPVITDSRVLTSSECIYTTCTIVTTHVYIQTVKVVLVQGTPCPIEQLHHRQQAILDIPSSHLPQPPQSQLNSKPRYQECHPSKLTSIPGAVQTDQPQDVHDGQLRCVSQRRKGARKGWRMPGLPER